MTGIESILPELIKQSPMAVVAIVALLLLWKVMEQKVLLATRYAEDCKTRSVEDKGHEDLLIRAMTENSKALDGLRDAIADMQEALRPLSKRGGAKA